MTAKFNPDQFWTCQIKLVMAATSREAVISALETALDDPSVDWGFAKDNAGHERHFPRPCFTDPRHEGNAADLFLLRDQVAQDEKTKPVTADDAAAQLERERTHEALFDRV